MENIGIVLSGGGIRCAAHIGVLKALEEFGISPSHISGSSGGALVGALYAAGHPFEAILTFFQENSNIFEWRRMRHFKTGLLDSEEFLDVLHPWFPEDNFDALVKKLFITATDLQNGETTIFSSGVIKKPLLASAAYPFIFTPLEINGILYADGGIMNNFPIEPLQPLFSNLIGSFVNPVEFIERSNLDHYLALFKRLLSLSNYANSQEKFTRCELLFYPTRLAQYGIFDNKHVDEIYQIGYEEARRQLASIS